MPQLEHPTAGDKPAVVLDVDGVIRLMDTDEEMPGYVIDPAFPWQRYNPEHGRWLKSLLPAADIYYISDRQADSHRTAGVPLGLPEFDWIDIGPHIGNSKSYAVARSLAITALFGRRPLVWIDDIITETQFEWAEQRTSETAPTLLIKPNGRRGLELTQMQQVDAWLQSLRTA